MLARGSRLGPESFESSQSEETKAREPPLQFRDALHAVIPGDDDFQFGSSDLLVERAEAAIEGRSSIHDRDNHR
jgi:hypothetical protein